MKITRFEDIDGWKAARRLADAFDRVVRESRFVGTRKLLNQMLDCTDSAMANIVEGFDAHSDPEFLRFLKIAYRSVSEFQSHLYFALDRRYLDKAVFDDLYSMARETKALIGGFMRYLNNCLQRSRSKKKKKPAAT